MKRLQSFAEKILKKPLTRELIAYGFFGVGTTIVGIGTYGLFLHIGLGVALSNTLSHILAILFAYITNKLWVFRALSFSVRDVAKEFSKFVSSRLVSYVVDTLLLVLLVDVLHYNAMWSKVFTSVFVVILNYIASKKLVFR